MGGFLPRWWPRRSPPPPAAHSDDGEQEQTREQAEAFFERVSERTAEREAAGVNYEELPDLPDSFAAEAARSALQGRIPVKSRDGGFDVATFAGGCFWGVEAYFKKVPGVIATSVGFTQGKLERPTYRQVCGGDTGHVEAVQLIFDPLRTAANAAHGPLSFVGFRSLPGAVAKKQEPGFNRTVPNCDGDACTILRGYEALLRVFFDHTSPPDGTDPDVGSQYRNGIYFHQELYGEMAQRFVEEEQKRRGAELGVEIKPATVFWPAEAYHQNFAGQAKERLRKRRAGLEPARTEASAPPQRSDPPRRLSEDLPPRDASPPSEPPPPGHGNLDPSWMDVGAWLDPSPGGLGGWACAAVSAEGGAISFGGATVSEGGTISFAVSARERWLHEWHERLEDWWIATPYRDELRFCLAAFALSLGSKLQFWLRKLQGGGILGGGKHHVASITQEPGTEQQPVAESGCEWVGQAEKMDLPAFPMPPEPEPSDEQHWLRLLPPIPARLLLPDYSRLQSLGLAESPATATHSTATQSPPVSYAAAGAGVGGGLALVIMWAALRVRRRQQESREQERGGACRRVALRRVRAEGGGETCAATAVEIR